MSRGIRRERIRQDFDRDVAIELRVARPIDLAHPAGAERRENLVLPEAGSGRLHRGYFRRSATFAMPAFAQASSCSCVEPELAMAPIVSLPALIGTPPPSARMSATSRCARYFGSSVRF